MLLVGLRGLRMFEPCMLSALVALEGTLRVDQDRCRTCVAARGNNRDFETQVVVLPLKEVGRFICHRLLR